MFLELLVRITIFAWVYSGSFRVESSCSLKRGLRIENLFCIISYLIGTLLVLLVVTTTWECVLIISIYLQFTIRHKFIILKRKSLVGWQVPLIGSSINDSHVRSLFILIMSHTTIGKTRNSRCTYTIPVYGTYFNSGLVEQVTVKIVVKVV